MCGVPLDDGLGSEGAQYLVPELEEAADLVIGDRLGNSDALRDNGGVVVGNLPLILLEYVDEGVADLHNKTYVAHHELADPYHRRSRQRHLMSHSCSLVTEAMSKLVENSNIAG